MSLGRKKMFLGFKNLTHPKFTRKRKTLIITLIVTAKQKWTNSVVQSIHI